jgi:hypothetical protein
MTGENKHIDNDRRKKETMTEFRFWLSHNTHKKENFYKNVHSITSVYIYILYSLCSYLVFWSNYVVI